MVTINLLLLFGWENFRVNTVASLIQSQLTRPAYSLWCAIVCAAVFCLWLSLSLLWSSSPSLQEKCFFTAYRLVQCKVLQLRKVNFLCYIYKMRVLLLLLLLILQFPVCVFVTGVLLEVGSEGGWFGIGSEDWDECSAIVVIVYECKWRCSPTYLAVPISVVSDLVKSNVQTVHVLQCAVVVGCCVCLGGVVSQWVLNLSNPSSGGLPQSSSSCPVWWSSQTQSDGSQWWHQNRPLWLACGWQQRSPASSPLHWGQSHGDQWFSPVQ